MLKGILEFAYSLSASQFVDLSFILSEIWEGRSGKESFTECTAGNFSYGFITSTSKSTLNLVKDTNLIFDTI